MGIKTKNRILAATCTLIIKNGYASTGIRDIAKQCNLASASIYTYYTSKDEIIIEALQLEMAVCENKLLPIASKKQIPLQERVSLFSRELKNFFRSANSCFIYSLIPELYIINHRYKNLIHTYLKLWNQLLNTLFCVAHQKNDHIVQHIISHMHGAILLSRLLDDYKYLDQFCDDIIKIVSKIHKKSVEIISTYELQPNIPIVSEDANVALMSEAKSRIFSAKDP